MAISSAPLDRSEIAAIKCLGHDLGQFGPTPSIAVGRDPTDWGATYVFLKWSTDVALRIKIPSELSNWQAFNRLAKSAEAIQWLRPLPATAVTFAPTDIVHIESLQAYLNEGA